MPVRSGVKQLHFHFVRFVSLQAKDNEIKTRSKKKKKKKQKNEKFRKNSLK